MYARKSRGYPYPSDRFGGVATVVSADGLDNTLAPIVQTPLFFLQRLQVHCCKADQDLVWRLLAVNESTTPWHDHHAAI